MNDAGLTMSTCTPICGDQKKVAGEIWDDNNISDGIGCKADCSGSELGYLCSGGTITTPTTWTTVCGDGYYRGTEQCDDGDTSSGDGCSSACTIESAFLCINSPSLPSVWTTTWGDGLLAGSETCDDGNWIDNQGCKDDCIGSIRGWYWGGGSFSSPSTCSTAWRDGIRITGFEDWDDGNTVNSGDGCTNLCIIEPKWSWEDNLLGRSEWQPKWGNGKKDHADEEWDDENYDDGDGCSSQWITEEEFECIGGTVTNRDYWYPQPIVSISDISSDNIFTISFTQKMVQVRNINKGDIEYWMEGPISRYDVSISSKFVDDYIIEIIVLTNTPFVGSSDEFLNLKFSRSVFLSQNATTLYNNKVKGNTHKILVYPDLVEAAGESTNLIMTTTMVTIISANLIMGQSSSLLWGFMNTIQIIYFMPLLSMYYPEHYGQFLAYLTSAKVQVDMIGISKYFPSFEKEMGDSDLGMPALNSKYEGMGYNSNSVLINSDDLFSTITTGIISLIIIFGIKAMISTLRPENIENLEREMREKEDEENRDEIVTPTSSERIEESKLKKKAKRWARSKH